MLPKHQVTKYFAFTLVVTIGGGSVNDYYEVIETRDELELFEMYAFFRTRLYLSEDPWNADES